MSAPCRPDGLEYVHIQLKESGAPIEIVYPREGTPFIPSCEGIAKNAPHPNAAKLFVSFMVSRETQQFLVDNAGLRSFHPEVKEKAGRGPLSQIKILPSDPGCAGGSDRRDQEKVFAIFRDLILRPTVNVMAGFVPAIHVFGDEGKRGYAAQGRA